MSERGVSLRVMFVHAGQSTQDSWCWHAHSVPGAHKCATRGCIIITYLRTKHSKVAFEIPKFTCSGQSGGATPWASSLCPKLSFCFFQTWAGIGSPSLEPRNHWCQKSFVAPPRCPPVALNRWLASLKSLTVDTMELTIILIKFISEPHFFS